MIASKVLSVLVGFLVASGAWGFYGSAQAVLQPLDSALETFVRQALEDRLAVSDIPDIKLLGTGLAADGGWCDPDPPRLKRWSLGAGRDG